jgi:hypothetical protein
MEGVPVNLVKPVSNRSGRCACGVRDCQRHISDPGRLVEQIADESWNDPCAASTA